MCADSAMMFLNHSCGKNHFAGDALRATNQTFFLCSAQLCIRLSYMSIVAETKTKKLTGNAYVICTGRARTHTHNRQRQQRRITAAAKRKKKKCDFAE